MKHASKWILWALAAATLVAVVFISSLLILAYRENSSLEYIPAAMLVGVAANLLFKETRILYLAAGSLPFLSALVLPQFLPTIMTALVAVVWIALSFGLSLIRRWI